MTHFRCAVFAKDPSKFEELLAPYGEQNENYFSFIPVSKESIKRRYESNAQYYDNFSQFMEDTGYVYSPDDPDVIGYYGNRNATWDWYTMDSYEENIDLRENEVPDDTGEYRKNQFSYYNKKLPTKELRERYSNIQKIVSNDANHDHPDWEYASWFINRYPTLDDYLEYCRWGCPAAYITPDGVWHAAGNIGWFASTDSTPESERAYFQEWKDWINSDDNPYVNIVDCHI